MGRSNTILNTVVLYFSNKMLLYNVQPKKKKKKSLLFNSLSENDSASSLIPVPNELQICALFHVASPTHSHHQTLKS